MAGWRTALLCAVAMAGAGAAAADPLVDGFRDPPQSARPRVFWHWMNGNVSAEGIRLDLEWMKRVGLGGAMTAEVDLATPVIVDRRVGFATPEWTAMVAEASRTAQRLGLELGVFTSPGWSDMGAPFVAPADAMKKLVWSSSTVMGGRRLSLQLPAPPAVAGPFQDVAGGQMTSSPWQAPPPFYRDAAVVAYRVADLDRPLAPATVTASAGPVDAALLDDGKLSETISLPVHKTHPQAWIRFDYPAAQTIRSVTLAFPAPRGFGASPLPQAKLEASVDGRTFQPVCDIPITSGAEQTVSFPAVRAVSLKVVFAPAPGPAGPPLPPGLAPLPFGGPAKAWLVSELRFSAAARVDRAEDKAGFSVTSDYDAVATSEPGPGSAVEPRDVVDLTDRMQPDGRLDWQAPPGSWIVLRLGYGLTGQHNGPAAPDATGLEVDKLSAVRVRAYLEHWLALHGQAGAARPLQALLNDSIEAGPQNWTDDMLAQFRRRRGYDATRWLPVLAGVIVQDAAASDRFAWDFRRTLAELFAESHYGVEAAVAHEHGLTLYNEALEDHRPQLGDDLEMRRYADVPMGAMWTWPEGGAPQPTYVADDLGAASVAHLWGANIAGAESMTAFGQPWGFAPRDLKPVADEEFALGVNRLLIHTSAHQPLTDKAPQMSLAPFLGQYFSRTETWAEAARPWIDYLARSSFLLQQGRFSADVAYFYGEEGPLTALYGDALPKDLPTGYGFDFVNADALTTLLSVKDGRLVTPSGMTYRLLYLGGSSRRMTVATLQRLLDLVRAGAVLVGDPPQAPRSLSDDPQAFACAVHALWPAGSGGPGVVVVGQGRVFSGRTPIEALHALGVAPDVEFPGAADDTRPAFVHRRLADGDLYFISNRTA